jgi:ornithine carbamoyltransferase
VEKRDLVSINDLSRDRVLQIFQISRELKAHLAQGVYPRLLENRVLALIFEKPSLRTRVTFEVGILQLGGHAISMMSHEIGIGKRESCYDVAKNLERWVDLVAIRTFGQDIVEQLAAHARIPIINALTDEEHPCQALTDLFTLSEHFDDLRGLTLAFVGDGNNICNSLLLLCPMLGVNIAVACPTGYCPPEAVIEQAERNAAVSGSTVEITSDPAAAVRNANAIYTDVWASMGQESERDERHCVFAPYQVNAALVGHAPRGAKIMHDLPAHRGEEITDDVIDSPESIVFDQAENRLHVQKGIMVFLRSRLAAAGGEGVARAAKA